MQKEKANEKSVMPDKPIANATTPANSSPTLAQPNKNATQSLVQATPA